MGRKSRFAKKKNKQAAAAAATKDGTNTDARGAGYTSIARENANFEKYYKIQKIVPEEEWEQFMSTLKENLPSSFRITNFKGEARLLLNIFKKEYCEDLMKLEEKPVSLPWYPSELAWQLNLTRSDIRKCDAYIKLHNFLMSETDSGYINRQETVSMLPPILLDVKPHHKVLDMCAAPGSKTAQLIEAMHAGQTNLPDGVLVANDVDNKRCYMLVHQAKRLQSPSFLITNHDASMMPNIRVPQGVIKYDRILCDVPCGGDGTLRKNFDVWKKWNVANSNGIHGLQVKIGMRGLNMLAIGGRMVYSTCSLNPVEDEAVVHRLLVECAGSVRLVDVSDRLPGLKVVPGLSSWTVMSKRMEPLSGDDDAHPRRDLFPPAPEDADKFNLNRCFRVLPHHQNTGGFFVALLEKVALLPGEKAGALSDNEEPAVVEKPIKNDKDCSSSQADGTRSPPQKKKRVLMQGYKEDPFVFFLKDEPIWSSIRTFYGVNPSFDPTLLMTRCRGERKRNLYLVCQTVKDVIQNNEERLKVINTGIKVFSRTDNRDTTCGFRLTHEGISTMLPYLTKRIVRINRQDLINLLTNEMSIGDQISAESRSQLDQMPGGSVALVYEDRRSDLEEEVSISLVGWKGKTSVKSYIPKNEKVHFLRMVGADTTKFDIKKTATSKSEQDNGDGTAGKSVQDAPAEPEVETPKMEVM